MGDGTPARRRATTPLDAAALDRIALRYVERFATTRARLADYLRRKIRERGWDGEPVDPAAIAERFAHGDEPAILRNVTCFRTSKSGWVDGSLNQVMVFTHHMHAIIRDPFYT